MIKFWEKSSQEENSPVVTEDSENPAGEKGKDGKGSIHYGDPGYEDMLNNPEDYEEEVEKTTWGEVCRSCCCHSAKEWGHIFIYLCGICFFLYFFIFSLELLGTGAKVLTGCAAAGLFGDNTNPVAALIIGMLVTVLLQSSSTTTSIIVSLVGSGAITVEPAIYMVMGANIGTSVTNTIVAMGQMGDGDELERAFAGATVHDMFNFLSVLILFPLEIITHMLARMTEAMTRNFEPNSDAEQKTKGIKAIIGPLLDRLIKANSKVIDQIATGQAESCAVYYPTECNPSGTTTYEACVTNGRVGLITCSKELGICPAFFQEGATESDDIVSGAVALFLGIFFLVICLLGLVFILKKMLLGASTRMIHKATDVNGYISMLIGTGITVLVQSSSVTTSVLTPLVGIGLVTVEQMYPFTLGANIGTTITGLLAAVVASTAAAMQVALAHFFFNIFGIIIWYPLPFMRRVPIHLARGLGKATRWWRGFPILYIAVCFFGIPLILLGISALFTSGSKGLVVLGAILCIVLGLGLVKFLYWWCRQDGRYKTEACFRKRQKRKDIYNEIVDEWEPLKDDVEALKDHTGYVAPDEEDEEQALKEESLKEESLKEEPKLTGHTVEEEEMSGEEMEVDDRAGHPRGSALSSSGLDRSFQA